jgi:hypothetical protein
MRDESGISEKPDDIDAKMYSPFYCIDCGQEFGSRKELEEHEAKHENLSKSKDL